MRRVLDTGLAEDGGGVHSRDLRLGGGSGGRGHG